MKISNLELNLIRNGYSLIAGVDEAGRGPLAGPVVSAAVILPLEFDFELIEDSKILTSKQREKAYSTIVKYAVSIGINASSPKKIDQINILQATMHSMRMATLKLKILPDMILIDGNRIPDNLPSQSQSIIKGDRKILVIAAASIIAKITRDRLMINLDKLYPRYGFAQHKGYATSQHLSALKSFGVTAHHRFSFSPIRQNILELS